MQVVAGDVTANLTTAQRMIARAKEEACQIVVLPECLDAGWTSESARAIADEIPGRSSGALCEAAAAVGIFAVAGITERAGARLFNTAVLVSPSGEVLAKHRKINELEIARDLYSLGNTITVTETAVGRIGMTICADNFSESLAFSEAQACMGAQLILSPCAWVVDADRDDGLNPYGDIWRKSYAALTSKYPVHIVGVSSVGWLIDGPWKGRKGIGCSLAYGPGGKQLIRGPFGEDAACLLTVNLKVAGGSTSSVGS